MDISLTKRERIIVLAEHTSMTYRQIAEIAGVGLGSVSRIIKKKQQTGTMDIKRKGICGRKRKTTARDDKFLVRKSKMNPRKSAVDLNKELYDAGIIIDVSTVRRRLLEAGRRARKPIKKQLLTTAMMNKRLAWAKKYQNWTTEDWSKVLFSDETHLIVQGERVQYVRRANGDPISPSHLEQRVKHPAKVMFWGCFSMQGTGCIVPITGMMNSVQYLDILQTNVIPELQKVYPANDSVFQHDLAPCHTSKKVKQFLTQHQIKVLEWPGNSPDLNPIENLWAICKNQLSKIDCTTKTKVISAINRVWFHDEHLKECCENLVKSMPTRVQAVIKTKGGHIPY